MKIIKLLLVLIIGIAVIASLWYYRPWSPYSPAKFASLNQVENLTYNFTHMIELVPGRTLSASATPRELEQGELVDISNVKYEFGGETKTIKQFIEEASVLGFMVIKDGKVRHESYYQGTDQESLYTSWSMAKSFVATAIAQAVKSGRIESWSDPVEKYAPQYAGSDYGSTSIGSLMAMATGIDFNEDYADQSSDINDFFFGAFIKQQDPDSLLLKFKRTRSEMNDFHYISPNSHVLSAVLRGVYGTNLVDVIQTQLWGPLGMGHSANWLQHKDGDEGQGLGYCCLNATVRDYARFGLFHMEAQQGQGLGADTLPSEWVASLTQAPTDTHKPGGENYSGRGYSSHFWLPINQPGVFFAAGVYGQFIWMDPTTNTLIVRTSSDPEWTPRYPESEAVMGALIDAFR